MTLFKRFIDILNRLKTFDIWKDKDEILSKKEQENLQKIPTQNPYGLIGMVLGGVAFIFGPIYGWLPVMVIVFCSVTRFTFDKDKEDNAWTFYVGLTLSFIGLIMFIKGEIHHLIV